MKIKIIYPVSIAVTILGASPLSAATLLWNFTGATTGAVSVAPGASDFFTVSTFTIGNSLGAVTTPIGATSVSNFTNPTASGTNNIGNAIKTGALDTATSSYVEVTIDPDAGYTISLTDLDFGIRSTGTGAQAYSIRSSVDSYATSIVSGTISSNSAWAYKNNTFSTYSTTSPDTAVTFRIYFSGVVGSPTAGTITTRLDDISLTITAVPEPDASALIGAVGLIGLLRRRR